MRQKGRLEALAKLMGQNLHLTPKLREELKKPLGILVRGTPTETMRFLRDYLEEKRNMVLMCVGDYCSRNAVEAGLAPRMIVIDSRIMRMTADSWSVEGWAEFRLNNPAGVISTDAWKILREAISLNRQAVVYVEGEEDLLTLPVVALAPENTAVIYGQPMEGLVIVEVTPQKKDWTLAVLHQMESEWT